MTLTKPLKSTLKGFTLGELTIILVIASIIIATIVLRFINLRTQIEQSAVQTIAEGLNAASVANCQLSRTDPTKAISVQNCQDVENTLPDSLPNEYEIISKPISNAWTICEVRHTETLVTGEFVGYRVP